MRGRRSHLGAAVRGRRSHVGAALCLRHLRGGCGRVPFRFVLIQADVPARTHARMHATGCRLDQLARPHSPGSFVISARTAREHYARSAKAAALAEAEPHVDMSIDIQAGSSAALRLPTARTHPGTRER